MFNTTFKLYTDALNFITGQRKCEDYLCYEETEQTKNRLYRMMWRVDEGTATAAEKAELDAYEDVQLFMDMKRRQAQKHNAE
jgi:hypothetical protein